MRVFISLLFIINLSYGALWSSSGDDGIRGAFREYNNRVKSENNKVTKRYENMKNGVVENILNNDKLKLELLSKHNTLLLDETTEKYNYELEFNKLKHLLNIEGTEK